jgi:ABC-type transport system involved in multi-copper enzyme maturation permease subunit
VSQTAVVARLAIRELWISFRLLVLLAAYVGTGAIVALLPAPPSTMFWRLALGLAVANLVGAAVAADAIGTERALGRAAWLVTRSISRSTLLVGWFLALAAVSLVGIGATAILAWLAVASPLPPATMPGYVTVMAGVAATGLAAIALGLLLGVLMRPRPATAAALVVAAAAMAAAVMVPPSAALPHDALAELPSLDRPIGVGLRGAGIGLAATAAGLAVARAVLGRVDL